MFLIVWIYLPQEDNSQVFSHFYSAFCWFILQQYEQMKSENEQLKKQIAKMADELCKANRKDDNSMGRRVSDIILLISGAVGILLCAAH